MPDHGLGWGFALYSSSQIGRQVPSTSQVPYKPSLRKRRNPKTFFGVLMKSETKHIGPLPLATLQLNNFSYLGLASISFFLEDAIDGPCQRSSSPVMCFHNILEFFYPTHHDL